MHEIKVISEIVPEIFERKLSEALNDDWRIIGHPIAVTCGSTGARIVVVVEKRTPTQPWIGVSIIGAKEES